MIAPVLAPPLSVCAVEPESAAWLSPVLDWLPALMRSLRRDGLLVRIVLAAVRGSAPREPGVSMLVSDCAIEGTIGGGQLEWQAVAAARILLSQQTVPARTQRLVLAADLGQCCGGVVELWMERYTRADLDLLQAAHEAALRGPAVLCSTITSTRIERRVICELGLGSETDQMLRLARAEATPRLNRDVGDQISLLERLDDALPPLWLFGAGYVGQALARMAMELPLRLTWIDSRPQLLPAQLSDAVRIMHSADPVACLAGAPSGARYVVLTHSHALDYALCRAILARGDFAWLGLIGSKSKAARFRLRLSRDGLSAETIARLVCPIGVGGIASKWPAAIALGVAAQLMQQISASRSQAGSGHHAGSADTHQACGSANHCESCRTPGAPDA
jgi:xanthine dehydrogenase accessory factor